MATYHNGWQQAFSWKDVYSVIGLLLLLPRQRFLVIKWRSSARLSAQTEARTKGRNDLSHFISVYLVARKLFALENGAINWTPSLSWMILLVTHRVPQGNWIVFQLSYLRKTFSAYSWLWCKYGLTQGRKQLELCFVDESKRSLKWQKLR